MLQLLDNCVDSLLISVDITYHCADFCPPPGRGAAVSVSVIVDFSYVTYFIFIMDIEESVIY